MSLTIKTVEPMEHFKLKLGFSDGVEKIFDALPLLEYTEYKNLRDDWYFEKVKIDCHGVRLRWEEGEEFEADMLHVRGETCRRQAS